MLFRGVLLLGRSDLMECFEVLVCILERWLWFDAKLLREYLTRPYRDSIN